MVSPWNLVARGLVYNILKVTTASTPFPTEASPYISLVHKLHCWGKMPLGYHLPNTLKWVPRSYSNLSGNYGGNPILLIEENGTWPWEA